MGHCPKLLIGGAAVTPPLVPQKIVNRSKKGAILKAFQMAFFLAILIFYDTKDRFF